HGPDAALADQPQRRAVRLSLLGPGAVAAVHAVEEDDERHPAPGVRRDEERDVAPPAQEPAFPGDEMEAVALQPRGRERHASSIPLADGSGAFLTQWRNPGSRRDVSW